MPFYSILFVIAVVVSATLALLMFTPVVVLIDSSSCDVKVRWSFLLSYASPLPGTETDQELELTVAGMSVPLRRLTREPPPNRKNQLGAASIKTRERHRRIRRFMWNCLLDRNIRSALVRGFRRLSNALWDAVQVSRLNCEVSLRDPAVNGLLWGVLATAGGPSRAWFQCNFMRRNGVRTELRFYPYRLLKAVLFFFLQLPYQAMRSQWSAS
jgi:hypothetical protein